MHVVKQILFIVGENSLNDGVVVESGLSQIWHSLFTGALMHWILDKIEVDAFKGIKGFNEKMMVYQFCRRHSKNRLDICPTFSLTF